MFTWPPVKARTGRTLDNLVLSTEGWVTMIDGILATAVLAGVRERAVNGLWRGVAASAARRGGRGSGLKGRVGR
jgi:hypothetical protein